MPDSKITALTSILTSTDPANDPLVIVDVSDTSMAATGTTKKVTLNQLLGASGTATLASATITGAASAAGLSVTGSTIPTNGVYLPSANNLGFAYNSTLGMTLNSTGLGVGRTPGARLDTQGTTSDSSAYAFFARNSVGNAMVYIRNDGRCVFGTGASDNIFFEPSGNVGIGGSPSAKLHVVGGNLRINDSYQLEFGGSTNSIAGSNANNTMNIYTNNVLRVSAKANGQVRFIPLAADPSGAEAGDVYYNSVSNRLKYYNGTAWTLI